MYLFIVVRLVVGEMIPLLNLLIDPLTKASVRCRKVLFEYA